MRWVIGLLLVTACGPTLDTNARHVMIELDGSELVSGCEQPCQRFLHPDERVKRCAMQESGWYLNPRFAGEPDPPPNDTFDMATIVGPQVDGFAVCTFVRGSK